MERALVDKSKSSREAPDKEEPEEAEMELETEEPVEEEADEAEMEEACEEEEEVEEVEEEDDANDSDYDPLGEDSPDPSCLLRDLTRRANYRDSESRLCSTQMEAVPLPSRTPKKKDPVSIEKRKKFVADHLEHRSMRKS